MTTMRTAFTLLILLACLPTGGRGAAAAVRGESNLPPFVKLTDHGGVRRDHFPVTGSIPLPEGVLREQDLSRLVLTSAAARSVPVQCAALGRWPDGSVKWLLLDFQSTQAPGSTVRYRISRGAKPSPDQGALARTTARGIEVDTGRLTTIFGPGGVKISLHGSDRTPDARSERPAADDLVSRIDVRRRDTGAATRYTLPLSRAVIETNGPLRAVLKVEGWHTAEGRQRFSPSVVRLTFYQGQPFVRVQHTFVNSENPDTHLIRDISLEMPLSTAMEEAAYAVNGQTRSLAVGGQRAAVFQEDIAPPTYPPSREFKGRVRVFQGEQAAAEGERYPGSLVLRGTGLGVGIFLKDMWQMSPKTLAYDPAGRKLQVGLWPGKEAGDLDLMRTECRKPDHYQMFAAQDPLYHDEQYPPTYVPHDLRHSAMGISRTHEVVLWFAPDPARLDPVEMVKQFTLPYVPFVSGAWNVGTGVMGKQVLPGQYRSDIEAVNGRIMADLRQQIDQWGWYGLFEYGNVRYAWDKTKRGWMNYHPKFAWYNGGHMMSGGTMLQALWHQYLRSGDPLDYMLAEARGLNKMDVSTVHFHQDPELVGAMIRHGGFDPWAGNRATHGAHQPLCGLPLQHFVTGSGRARDVVHLIGRRNYQTRHFEHGRNMDTDIDTMMRYHEFTGDRRYFDRAAEFVNYYHRTLEEARSELTFMEYRTTALRNFREMCRDPELRRKAEEVFLASLSAGIERGRIPSVEMAALAYEITRSPEAARQLEESVEGMASLISGQLGWSDNMVLRGMNDIARMNGLVYGLYWLQEIHKGTTEPVTIQPDGGTFAKPIAVTLSCPTPGAAIRYTLDGSEPTERSPVYRRPLLVSRNSTVKAVAFKADLRPRSVSQAVFTLGGPPFSRERLELWLRADAGVSVSPGQASRASALQESEGPGEVREEVPQRGESEVSTPRSLPDARDPRREIVTWWADQSGNGRHAQASGDRAPAFVSDGPGHHPVVRGGNGQSMTLRRLVPLPDDCAFVFVGSFTGNNSAVVGDGDDGWFGMRELGPGEFTVRFSVGERGFNARLRPRYEPGRFAVWSVVRNGGRVTIYRNGRRATERPDYPSDGSTMNLGLLMGMRPRNVNLKGDLAELLVFSRALSDDHRVGIERYLAEKYRLRE